MFYKWTFAVILKCCSKKFEYLKHTSSEALVILTMDECDFHSQSMHSPAKQSLCTGIVTKPEKKEDII